MPTESTLWYHPLNTPPPYDPLVVSFQNEEGPIPEQCMCAAYIEPDGTWHFYGTKMSKERITSWRLRDAIDREHPLFRDYTSRESIWIIFEDGRRIKAVAVEQPNDQSTFTFEAAPGHFDDWPDEWEERTPDECNEQYTPYIMAGSDGLYDEDMHPWGPYPDVYGQMLWTWEHEEIKFTTRPRERELTAVERETIKCELAEFLNTNPENQ